MRTPSIDEIRRRLQGYRLSIVPYCHADWAWTHTRHWHEVRYVKVMDDVLDILDAQDEEGVPADAPEAFRWYLDVYVAEVAPYLEARPERYEELRRRVSEGRLAVCGGYANVRVNHAEGETFLRSLIYGRRKFRELFPEADLSVHSDLVDVAVAHPQLPQVLSQAGYRGYQFWRPHQALDAKGIPHHFVWQGLDGSQVLCSRGRYSGLVGVDYAADDLRERWPEVVEFWWQNLLEAKVARAPVQILWLQHGADDSRPLRTNCHNDQPLDLPAVVTEWNQRETSSMRFATPVEVFRELEAVRERLPVVKGTLDPCDVSHKAALCGANSLWSLRRECGRAIPVVEMLDAIAVGLGAARRKPVEVQQECEGLWKSLLTFSCHASQWGFEDDARYFHSLAQSTHFRVREHQREALRELAGQIAWPDNAVAAAFNALPHERVATVPLRLTFVESDRGPIPAPLRLVDGRGEEVPYQVLDKMGRGPVDWELDTMAQVTLPAGGWNTVRWERSQPALCADAQTSPDRVENEFVELHFRLGRLMRIVDKGTGIEWDAPERTPFGHLCAYEVDTTGQLWMGPIIGQSDARWGSWDVVERGPVRWSVRSEGRLGPHRATLEARLYRGERRVEFHAQIECAGMDGFIASHLPYPGPGRVHGDMPFCVEEKDLAHEPYVGIERQRPGMFIAQSFVDWADGRKGMAYVSHDGDRYYVLDEDSNTLRHILINTFKRREEGWERHINQWADCVGTHEFTYSLIPHEGSWRDAQLWRVAHALRDQPLQAWPTARGKRPPYQSLVSVEPGNVTLSALYVEGDRILVRLFENAGREAEATLTLPFGVGDAQVVDLLGEPSDGAEPQVEGSRIMLRMRPWQIATVAVPLGEEKK